MENIQLNRFCSGYLKGVLQSKIQHFFSVTFSAFRFINDYKFKKTGIVCRIDRITEEACCLSVIFSCDISTVCPVCCISLQ